MWNDDKNPTASHEEPISALGGGAICANKADEANAAPSVDLARIYYLRAKAHFKANNFVKAKYDAQIAIQLRPNWIPAYFLLSDVEKEREQSGRAEVALVLGKRIDKDNQELVQKLAAFRAQYDGELPSIRYTNTAALDKYKKQVVELKAQ